MYAVDYIVDSKHGCLWGYGNNWRLNALLHPPMANSKTDAWLNTQSVAFSKTMAADYPKLVRFCSSTTNRCLDPNFFLHGLPGHLRMRRLWRYDMDSESVASTYRSMCYLDLAIFDRFTVLHLSPVAFLVDRILHYLGCPAMILQCTHTWQPGGRMCYIPILPGCWPCFGIESEQGAPPRCNCWQVRSDVGSSDELKMLNSPSASLSLKNNWEQDLRLFHLTPSKQPVLVSCLRIFLSKRVRESMMWYQVRIPLGEGSQMSST